MRATYLSNWVLACGLALAFMTCLSALEPARSADTPGLYVLLEVEVDQVLKDQAASTVDEIRRALRKAQIAYADLSANGPDVSVRIIDKSQVDQAVTEIAALNPVIHDIAHSAHQYSLAQPGDGRVVLTMTDVYKSRCSEDIVSQSIDVIRGRVNRLGVRRFSVERQGEDQIVVQVRGLQDNSEALNLFQPPPKLTFQLVDETGDVAAAQHGQIPPEDELLEQDVGNEKVKPPPLLVEKQVLVEGERLTNASWSNDQDKGQVVVTFRFDESGANQFADATKTNVGRRFALVLGGKVITAPVICEPILGGYVEIEGNFTVETANNLALLLRSGALPAPFRVLEKRTIK